MNESRLPGWALAATIAALLMAVVNALSAFDSPVAIAAAAVYALGAWGIVRRRRWSAYGLGLYHLASGAALALAPLVKGRFRSDPELLMTVVAGVALSVVLALLFWRGGVALEAAGGPRGWVAPWLVLSAVALASPVLLFFVGAYVMPTGAMEDTLLIGDHILVRERPRPAVERGMILVFRYPVNRDETFVKRVVGMPGDRIRIVNKRLLLNGEPLDEPYAINRSEYVDSFRDNFPSMPNTQIYPQALEMLEDHVVGQDLVVPDGRYFVLGDNRDHSLDSRYWGFVSDEDVVGVPFLIYGSVERETGPDGETQSTRTRWGRLFQPL